jgi:hypothetical protein
MDSRPTLFSAVMEVIFRVLFVEVPPEVFVKKPRIARVTLRDQDYGVAA